MPHRYLESRQGKPGDTKILALDPLLVAGVQVTSLQPGETITVTVTDPAGNVVLPATQAVWDIIHWAENNQPIFVWMVPFTLPTVTTATRLTITWNVNLQAGDKTIVDALEVIP